MILTRYYARKPLEIAHVRAARDLLTSKYNWSLSTAKYGLHYVSGHYSVDGIDEADKVVAVNGPPNDFLIQFISQGGRTLTIDTRKPIPISIELNNRSDAPEPLLSAIETVFGLQPLAESSTGRATSAFIAHSFDGQAQNLANELARFLTLLGIRCSSGRAFTPTRVSDKVSTRLAAHDLFFAIVTPSEDHTWLTQEISTAAAYSKPVFVLTQSDVEFKPGLLGDQEYIPFAPGELSMSFIPILEGVNAIAGVASELFPWQLTEPK
ncbi:MAG TPA: hypothetical protein VGM76_06445 [Lacipirellulaceae bacterium]|jgi:hypothetical protein